MEKESKNFRILDMYVRLCEGKQVVDLYLKLAQF